MTPEERAAQMVVSMANAPTSTMLEELARRDAEILETGIIFQPNDHLLEDMVKQVRALEPQTPL